MTYFMLNVIFLAGTTSSLGCPKKDTFSLSHVIDNGDELPTSSTGSTVDQRRNMSTGLLPSSSMSQPRSSFNRQVRYFIVKYFSSSNLAIQDNIVLIYRSAAIPKTFVRRAETLET